MRSEWQTVLTLTRLLVKAVLSESALFAQTYLFHDLEL